MAATELLNCGRVAVDFGAVPPELLLDELELLDDELLLDELELLEEPAPLLDELELLDEDELDELEELEELEELVLTTGPTEHQALAAKLFVGNSEVLQVKAPVSVAYTKAPDLPSATVCVPLMLQALPTCAHLV